MKKTLKLSVIIVGGIVAALAIAVLVLSLISVNPLKRLPGNYTVRVYEPAAASPMAYNDQTVKTLNDAIGDSSFSVMQAVLEGRFSYSFKFKTEKVDGETKRIEMYEKQIKEYAATEKAYMLEFIYTEPVTLKVGKETITFDRLKVRVADMQAEIEKVELVPYLDQKIGAEPVDEYYYVTPIEVWMSTTKLYNALGTLQDAL